MTPEAPIETAMRAALQSLLKFQAQVPVADLPPYRAERLAHELALFADSCVKRHFGRVWTEAEQALWGRVSQRLVDSAVAQPVVAVRGHWSLADGARPPAAGSALAGPITCDLVALLRDQPHTDDESLELDWAVRWWKGAQHAGLPVDADFGEFWRALEWMGLHRQLMLLGRACREHHEGCAVDTELAEKLTAGLAAASKVALRYGPLKPLLRLLQPLQGETPGAGYTF